MEVNGVGMKEGGRGEMQFITLFFVPRNFAVTFIVALTKAWIRLSLTLSYYFVTSICARIAQQNFRVMAYNKQLGSSKKKRYCLYSWWSFARGRKGEIIRSCWERGRTKKNYQSHIYERLSAIRMPVSQYAIGQSLVYGSHQAGSLCHCL